jgi:hypothetical protein
MEIGSASSQSTVNFQRLPGQNVDSFLVERVAGWVAQFDVVVAGFQGNFLQFTYCPRVATVHIYKRILGNIHKFDCTGVCDRPIRIGITPIRSIPAPTGTIPTPPARSVPAPARSHADKKSASRIRRSGRHQEQRGQQGNRGKLHNRSHTNQPSFRVNNSSTTVPRLTSEPFDATRSENCCLKGIQLLRREVGKSERQRS